MRALAPELLRTAAAQADVLSGRQLLEHLTTGEVRSRIRSGRWQRAGRSVVVLHNGPLTELQQVWAALLQSPEGSAVSGPTSMALNDFVDPWAKGIHITIPCGQRAPVGLDAVVHWSNFLGPHDIAPKASPRRTRMPRSVVDWASWQPTERAARLVVLRAAQSGKVSTDQLRSALPTRGPCRHHAVILESVIDVEGGIQSVPEHDFRELVRRAGLPLPTHQVVRRQPSGRYFLDVGWDEFRLSAEVQGVHHFEAATRDKDLDRQNDLVVEGESLLQFTSYAVRHQQPKVAETLRRALAHRGWSEGVMPSSYLRYKPA